MARVSAVIEAVLKDTVYSTAAPGGVLAQHGAVGGLRHTTLKMELQPVFHGSSLSTLDPDGSGR